MKYVSTRGNAPELEFDDVLLAGLARDGGLYVPSEWPTFSADEFRAMKDLSYNETAFRVIRPFIDASMGDDDLAALIEDTYSNFDDNQIAPLKHLGDREYLLELFHGPTLAFKDIALQFLGRMFDHVLHKRDEHITVVGATSGDTGSAAIEACRGRDSIDIFILHPEGRVTDVQRRQMTTVTDANVHNIAIKGTFDDCQNLVKAMFNDTKFRDAQKLSAVNSINWVRVMVQVVYYVRTAVTLGAPDKSVSFAVPTGNFGNCYAGWGARKLGLPIDRLFIGTNRNDILHRFLESGHMQMAGIHPTISPSMDIQISSNFERMLFALYGGDAEIINDTMNAFADTGEFSVRAPQLEELRGLFASARFDDDQTKAIIKDVYESTGELLDPHSAIAVGAGRAGKHLSDSPCVALATAHPAKFPDAVEDASGVHPALPAHLADLFEREEKFVVLDNNLEAVQAFIQKNS
ncbi:MAG: threonine synthase [Rhodospirillaceae bacterium]|nr:threonine synthase [Rhodospirillaceae bacterium]MBT4464927.1 threonine synthase [Rhodospirillaceae bacterium]MBT6406149.1 threonine synthase [Rhodospirillaceae bacterium]MBT7355035.1 threonine synthase [Rhodospirillaceae bacterium]